MQFNSLDSVRNTRAEYLIAFWMVSGASIAIKLSNLKLAVSLGSYNETAPK